MSFPEFPFRPATLLPAILALSLLASPARSAEAPLERVAMGSCNRQSEPQPLWEPILAFQPQLWIWLGDNVYGDTTNMAELARKYSEQKNNPGYSKLLSSVPVVGLWDDHDYGDNDSGFNFPKKRESQKLFLDFFDEPADSPRRKRDGIYDARSFGPDGKKVLVVLLDVRFWRPPPNSGGDILGEAQWRWLEKTLRESDAQVHLLCSGTQFLPTEHRWEKWNDYPDSRRRLLKLLARLKPPGTVLLSGDRHFSEIMSTENPYGGPDLHELTSSGLTHFWKNFPNEKNSLRLGEPFVDLSFGTLEIDWDARRIELAIRNAKGTKERTADFPF
jgi:alkaline phosphatase D